MECSGGIIAAPTSQELIAAQQPHLGLNARPAHSFMAPAANRNVGGGEMHLHYFYALRIFVLRALLY